MPFELKQEHIILMRNLAFQTAVSIEDEFIPEIDRKNPFHNGTVINSACELLCFKRNNEEQYDSEVLDFVENLIIELPVALEIVMKNQTFQPGIYHVDKYGAYYGYKKIYNFKLLKVPLKEVDSLYGKNPDYKDTIDHVRMICRSIYEEDPYVVVDRLKWFRSNERLDNIIAIFEKYQEQSD